MQPPFARLRRLRRTESLRRVFRETVCSAHDLILPLFVVPGRRLRVPIDALPGVERYSVDMVVEQVKRVRDVGVGSILLFGVPNEKDADGSASHAPDGLVQRAIRDIKRVAPDMVVMTDVCLCSYTDHGHCGVIAADDRTIVDNDATLPLLTRMAVSHAAAGADIVAPSDMMDGRVAAIRRALDEDGFSSVGLLSYAAKFASSFYGPFREAAESSPRHGDRRSYQLDPANLRSALREVEADEAEGADAVMVKPAMAYGDVIRLVRESTRLPVAAYSVSGEYAMIKAAAAQGWIDEKAAVRELLTSIRRAGADIIVTYHAVQAAEWLSCSDA